ncbi:acyl-CoA thioesterase/bile acid-CoA:amino acid N-acyltransferase family protein, partial [Shouchella sp. 1P01AA]
EDIKILIENESSVLDDFRARILTNHPMASFKLSLRTTDDNKRKFQSQATFKSDNNGVIDLNTQAPISGNYTSVDSNGLFWSMSSHDNKEQMFIKQTSAPLTFIMEVYSDSDRLLKVFTFTRCFLLKDIEILPVNETIVGTLYYPKNKTSLPAIVLLGGSDGSVHESSAALLATQGYAVLALAYFGKKGLPKGIENIPLEYVERSFNFLESKSFVNNKKFGIIGHSRGSELALLYASKHSRIRSVIAVAPSAIVFSGMLNFQATSQPAWTYKGEPFRFYTPERSFKDTVSFFRHLILKKPFSNIEKMKQIINDEDKLKPFKIPIQEIQAPIMFISGTDDHVQPAELFVKQMQHTLRDHKYSENNKFLFYKGAGHFSAFPANLSNLPQTLGTTNFNMTMIFGGTKENNAKAAQQTWAETIRFLKTTLANSHKS